MALAGGCQCGAIRYRVAGFGRASICHCRMCQKALGNYFAPFATAHGLVWTRGTPARFASSNCASRGFCRECGTPLSYEPIDGGVEIALGTLDDPAAVPPLIQVGLESKLPFVDALAALPLRPAGEDADFDAFLAGIVSRQHPDHD